MVRSLYAGVSGLTTHQTRMDVIGNNIANVNSHGFKASRTVFRDIFYQTSINETAGAAAYAGNNPSTVGYGVQLGSIDKDMSQSSFQNTGKVFDCAINGDGFFVTATFDGSKLKRDQTVKVGEKLSDPSDPNSNKTDVNINGLNNYDLTPLAVRFTRLGNMSVDSAGNLVLNNQFVIGTCNSHDGLQAVGDESAAALRELTLDQSFNECKKENATEANKGKPIQDLAGDADEDDAADITSKNIINVNELISRAYGEDLTFSDLESFQIGKDGMIQVVYEGKLKYIARIETAVFDNQDGLIEDGTTMFRETASSGAPHIKRAGQDPGAPKQILSNRLEMSNVNLANEFSDMIVTQRGYQANARIITTSDSMLEELVNLKR